MIFTPLLDKKVKVVLKDGTVFWGKLEFLTSALDDPDERENITIRDSIGRLVDIYTDEIVSIEEIKR